MALSYMQVVFKLIFPCVLFNCHNICCFSICYSFVTVLHFLIFLMQSASSFQADVSLGNEAAVPLSGRGGINTYIPLISK